MKEVIVATQMQQEVLTSNKRITTIAVGAGAGATYALYLKAITSEGDHVSFVSPTYKLSRLSFEYFCREFTGKLNARVSKSSQIITVQKGKKIKFTSPKNGLYDLKGLMLVDNAHNFPQEWLDHYIENTDNNIVFTSKPYECGWRNPVYENGMLQEGVFEGVSWDSGLVDWELYNQDKYISEDFNEKAFSTKACPSLYKSCVKAVSGCDVIDNAFLLAENPNYYAMLMSLPPKDRVRLSGEWVL